MSRVLLMLAGGMMVCGGGACTAPNPNRPDDASPDDQVDAAQNKPDAANPADAAQVPDASIPDAKPLPDGYMCTAGAFLRCEGDKAVSCNANGDNEDRVDCPLGCDEAKMRCNDIAPSNDLGQYLDLTAAEPDYVLTDGATMNTETGTVVNGDGSNVLMRFQLKAALVDGGGDAIGPPVGVFIVGSLTIQGEVTVEGENAIAIVSNGDVEIAGRLDISAQYHAFNDRPPGPGSVWVSSDESFLYGDVSCIGQRNESFAGSGGGGFGSKGGSGGGNATEQGTVGGSIVGNSSLIPLRGGCPGSLTNAGGGIQIVSRVGIHFVLGSGPAYIDASGDGGTTFQGGGSGGGILLEAPLIDFQAGTGLTANGGGGGGCGSAANGSLSTSPAAGGEACPPMHLVEGGTGGALTAPAGGNGESGDDRGASGGGGVGRIRINTPDGTFTPAGGAIISPAPSVGTLATR